MSQPNATINMVIAALGGEGGGVLTNWLIAAAELNGWWCQSTSLAGVAQRTGATIYYLEFMPRQDGKPPPVMSLFPAQGDIDIAVASEIAEAGRMVSRGFVSPQKTALITSDHRVFGITEKSSSGNGAIDRDVILEMGARYARDFIHFDMSEIVERHGTVISAALLGAIAGSKTLPFDPDSFRKLVAAGPGSDANLAAFDESRQRAASGGVAHFEPSRSDSFALPEPNSPLARRFLPRIASLPVSLHEVGYHSVNRLIDYLDEAYAEQWLDMVEKLIEINPAEQVSLELGRHLALWMAYEDIPRVAQLKIRPDREQAVREEVRASSNQPMELSEFFHPRLEEVAALLPVKWGDVLLRSGLARRCSAALLGPRTLRTDRLLMQLALRFLAGLRRFRRGTLGYAHEWEMINRWYQCVLSVAGTERALVVAQSGGLVKGYGETRHRTSTRLMSILDCIEQNADIPAQSIRTLLRLAMEPDSEEAFLTAVASHSAST